MHYYWAKRKIKPITQLIKNYTLSVCMPVELTQYSSPTPLQIQQDYAGRLGIGLSMWSLGVPILL